MHIQPNAPAQRPRQQPLIHHSPPIACSTKGGMESEWANQTDRYALAAHPGKSQGPPPNLTGSKPIVQTGVPDRVLHTRIPCAR
jgi:hypothetical protein